MTTALTGKTVSVSIAGARATLAAGAAGTLAAVALALPGRGMVADPDLLTLLSFMALIKGATALGAVALAWWRLGRTASRHLRLALWLGPWGMAGASLAIWQIQHLLPAMIVFYGGLALVLWAAFVDRE